MEGKSYGSTCVAHNAADKIILCRLMLRSIKDGNSELQITATLCQISAESMEGFRDYTETPFVNTMLQFKFSISKFKNIDQTVFTINGKVHFWA
jgi:hypothetical protein